MDRDAVKKLTDELAPDLAPADLDHVLRLLEVAPETPDAETTADRLFLLVDTLPPGDTAAWTELAAALLVIGKRAPEVLLTHIGWPVPGSDAHPAPGASPDGPEGDTDTSQALARFFPAVDNLIGSLTGNERKALRTGLLQWRADHGERAGDPLWTGFLYALLPALAPDERDAAERRLAAAPFRLHSLALRNYRVFEDFEWNLPAALPHRAGAAEAEGQWAFLIGDNGSGKSSVLRGLCLALAPPGVASALVAETGARAPNVRLEPPDGASVRPRAPDAKVTTRGAWNPPPLTIQLANDNDNELCDERSEWFAPFLIAYGARRGSALGGAAREVDLVTAVRAVETLFDEGAALIHAETWLKERKLEATEHAGAAIRLDRLLDALNRLLPGVSAITVGSGGVWFRGELVGDVPLGALSDAYVTTTGWVVDMMARWLRYAGSWNLEVSDNFPSQMTGIALIDELDLHLHPRWQQEIVPALRRVFPRMTFVVTTHNPLTLQSARPGEVNILRRTEAGEIELLQRDIPPGAAVDDILTGAWFELASTLDPVMWQLLDEFRLSVERDPDSEATRELRHRIEVAFLSLPPNPAIRDLLDRAPSPVSLTPDERKNLMQVVAGRPLPRLPDP